MTTLSPPPALPESAPPSRRGPSALLSALIMLSVVTLVAIGSFTAGTSIGAFASIPPAALGGEPDIPELMIAECTAPSEAFAPLCEVYGRIRNEYVDGVSDKELVEGAIRGMLEYGLQDPYSGYVPPEDMGTAFDQLSGSFSGIGAEVGIVNLADESDLASCTKIGGDCALVVIAPIPNSPAAEADLRAGDVIIAIDEVPTDGSTVEQEITRVRGQAGTSVTLSIERDGVARDIAIERQVIDLPMVDSRMLENKVGYVHLAIFGDGAAAQLREALLGLESQGMTALILDLRNNPGGYIDAAQDVASEFIDAGLLFTQESGETTIRWTAKPDGVATDPALTMMVLINGGSASASEIVAAALSETQRATLVGETTFGKNTVQAWESLPNGGGLRLTTDRWFTPKHNSVEGDGLQPDVVVPTPEGVISTDDPALERAEELLAS